MSKKTETESWREKRERDRKEYDKDVHPTTRMAVGYLDNDDEREKAKTNHNRPPAA